MRECMYLAMKGRRQGGGDTASTQSGKRQKNLRKGGHVWVEEGQQQMPEVLPVKQMQVNRCRQQ